MAQNMPLITMLVCCLELFVESYFFFQNKNQLSLHVNQCANCYAHQDQFLGFDDTIPCPKNYWKYANSSSKQQFKKLTLSKETNSSIDFHQPEKK